MVLGIIPSVWESGHVSLGTLWGLYSQYPYLPRLRDRQVLAEGVHHMPLLWQQDAFALAASYDEAAGRYVGLWIPEDAGSPPAAVDSLLLVRPEVAVRQRAADRSERPGPGVASGPTSAAEPGGSTGGRLDVQWPASPVPVELNTRFFGVKTLNPDRFAMEFKTIAEEVIAHLRQAGTDLSVRIEIEADRPEGFSDAEARTISENSRTLKFDQSGFEKS